VQDPGNVGALIRVAEAAGASGAVFTGASANPFSWKALRGSMGSALRLPVLGDITTEVALAVMKKTGLRTVAAVARDGRDPDALDWSGPLGLLLGGEGPGLAHDIVASCDQRVTIPMASPVESLNVAVAGAILVYAARRQRAARYDHGHL
jgi:TrmH family RNA methyltransferase